jgi:hypothetical protein
MGCCAEQASRVVAASTERVDQAIEPNPEGIADTLHDAACKRDLDRRGGA